MTSERANVQNDRGRSRPWPIYALTGLAVASLFWDYLVDANFTWWRVLLSVFSIWLAYALWKGSAWAFRASFMLATLSAGIIIFVAGIQLILFEQSADLSLLWKLAAALAWVGLLLHPSTKQFASD